LAAWTLDALAAQQSGIFNATGPTNAQSMGELLATCQRVAGTPSSLTWASPEFLAKHEVVPFLEMPLWVPPEMPGLLTVDCSRAIGAGLATRPAADTVRATLEWYAARPDNPPLKAGLPPDREAALLQAWHDHVAQSRAVQ
jgi:2'-hydroxyisoflavone reductase